MAVDNLPDSPSDSSQKPPSPRRQKTEPTDAELLTQIETAKRLLKKRRARQRQDEIVRLGRLAYKAGLASWSTKALERMFAGIMERSVFPPQPSDSTL